MYISLPSFSANVIAGGDDTRSLVGISKRDKSMVSKGFYLNIVFGFNSFTVPATTSTSTSANTGQIYVIPSHKHSVLQPTLEIGKQWMFFRADDEKWGIGMNISWLTLGYSNYIANVPFLIKNPDNSNEKIIEKRDVKFSEFQAGLLRLGPVFSYEINRDMAIDGFFNVNPLLRLGIAHGDDIEDAFLS